MSNEASARASAVSAEASARIATDEALILGKFDVSPYYSGGSESYFKVSNDTFLYIGDLWRIKANTAGSSKRLEFQYSATGLDVDFKTAVPFIRGN